MNPCKLTKKVHHTRNNSMTIMKTIKNLVMTEEENRNTKRRENQKITKMLQKCWNTNPNMTKTTGEGQGTEITTSTGAEVAPTGETLKTDIPTEALQETETTITKTEGVNLETDTPLTETITGQEREAPLRAEGLTHTTGQTEDLAPTTDLTGDQIPTTGMIGDLTAETEGVTLGQEMDLGQTVVQEMTTDQGMTDLALVKDSTETFQEKTLTREAKTTKNLEPFSTTTITSNVTTQVAHPCTQKIFSADTMLLPMKL